MENIFKYPMHYEKYPEDKDNNKMVQCCRCRNKHLKGQRLLKPSVLLKDFGGFDEVCPRCLGRNYYELDQKTLKV